MASGPAGISATASRYLLLGASSVASVLLWHLLSKRARRQWVLKQLKAGGQTESVRAVSSFPSLMLEAKMRLVVHNLADIQPPSEAGVLDNCLLCLPRRVREQLRVEGNMEDKGTEKELWFGRVWQGRALRTLYYQNLRKLQESHDGPPDVGWLREIQDSPRLMGLVLKIQKRWRAQMLRRISSLTFLEKIEGCMGFIVFMHGSGGMTGNNLRFARMWAGMGFIVICPDHMASSEYRTRVLQPLPTRESDTDYWAGNLVYASDTTGEYTYNTNVGAVLKDPEYYKTLYEKVYRARRNELHYVLHHLPKSVQTHGVFLAGTSEGAMTVARFDDQRYGTLINGRIISAFNVEYCYFTPTPAAGEFGGSLDVPTLQIIGDSDEYFGTKESIAQLVSADKHTGYGSGSLHGHALETMRRQGLECGCVCVFEEGYHDLSVGHDNTLRDLFEVFLRKPDRIHQLDEIWRHDDFLAGLVEVEDKVHKTGRRGLLRLAVHKSPYPATMTKSQDRVCRMLHIHEQTLQRQTSEPTPWVREERWLRTYTERQRQIEDEQHAEAERTKSEVVRALADYDSWAAESPGKA